MPVWLESLEPRVLFAGDFPITQVITATQPLPGGGNLTINPNREAVISDTGKVLVNGTLSGPGVVLENSLAMVMYDGAGVNMVLRELDAIPGAGGRVYTFGDYPFSPTFTGDDVVGFSLLVDSTQPGARGVWSSTPGSGGSNIALRSAFALNTSVDSQQDTGVSATGNVAYYVSGNPSRLFRNDVEVLAGGGPLSFGGEDYLLLSISDSVREINASDQFAIDMLIRPAEAFSLIDSVVVFGPGGVVGGVTEFTLDPGIPDVGVTDLSAVDINGAGQVLIVAQLQGNVSGATDQALYLLDGNTTTLIVREGDIIPGTNQPLAFTSLLPQFALSGGGQVLAQVNHDFASTVSAIAVWGGGSWQVVAKTGDPAPGVGPVIVFGEPTDTEFGDLGGAAINDSGTIVIGGAVRAVGGQQVGTGLWAYLNGQLSNIVFEGDQVTGQAGPITLDRLVDSRGLSKATLGTGENGRRTILNDDNRVVFASQNDGVFIANLSGPVQPGEIHGTVWSDDGDGAFELGEAGEPGVFVTLETPAGATVAGPVLTDGAGEYVFGNVEPGDYRVRVALPSNASFAPTGIDAEIGAPSGLSATFTLVEGGEEQLDAGLILPGPSATLTFPTEDIPFGLLVDIVQNPQPALSFRVRFNDNDRVDESSLAATRLSIVKFGTLQEIGVAVPDPQAGQLDGVDEKEEELTYRLDPPPEGWTPDAIADYLVRVSVPAKDKLGNDGAVDELAGLFSIVDNQPPELTPVSVSPELIGGLVLGEQIMVVVDYREHVLDVSSLGTGNIAYRPRFTTDEVPFELFAHDAANKRLTYRVFPPAGGFTQAHDDRYEIVTSAAAIKDEFNNAVAAGQVLGEFVIDFTPPEAMMTTTGGPTEGAAAFLFGIGWSDDGAGLDSPSLDMAQFRVRGPGGALPADAVTRVGHLSYSLDAPGDDWNDTDRGVYTIELANEEVKDTAGNKTPIGTIVGTFSFLVQAEESITNEGKNKATVNQDSGGVVKFLLNGAQIALEATVENELEKIVGKNDIIINGVKDLVRLIIDPDNPAASLQIAIDLKNDINNISGQIPFGAIEALGHMKQVVAPGIELVTDAIFPGLDKLVLGDVADDHLIMIGAPDDVGLPYVDITLDRVRNADLISLTPIRTLTVTEWIDDDGDPDVISAPWIGKIIVKGNKKQDIAGDFEASLDLSGNGAPKGLVLGSVTIAGDLRDADWTIVGSDAGSILVKGSVSSFGLGVDGGIKGLNFGDVDTTGVVAGGEIRSVQAVRWLDGAISAAHVSAMKITGNKTLFIPGDAGFNLTLQGLDNGKPRLGSVSIAGDLRDADWSIVGGDAGSILVKGSVSSFGLDVDGGIKGLNFGDVDATGVVAGGEIRSVQAVRWLGGQMTADTVNSIKTTGNRAANIPGDLTVALTILGNPAAKTVLGSATIAGVLSGAWNVTGPTGAIQAGDVNLFTGNVIGAVKSFGSKASFSGMLAAFSFATIDIKANLVNARLIAGGSATPAFINSLKIGGGVTGSSIFVGLDPVNAVFDDGDDIMLAGPTHLIKSMSVGGATDLSTPMFFAGLFPKTVLINKIKVDPLTDARFLVTSA